MAKAKRERQRANRVAKREAAQPIPALTDADFDLLLVEITVRVMGVDRRKISFEVAARDELDEISVGTHARFVVEIAKTIERLKAKAARRPARPG